jgi:hypothetical protein
MLFEVSKLLTCVDFSAHPLSKGASSLEIVLPTAVRYPYRHEGIDGTVAEGDDPLTLVSTLAKFGLRQVTKLGCGGLRCASHIAENLLTLLVEARHPLRAEDTQSSFCGPGSPLAQLSAERILRASEWIRSVQLAVERISGRLLLLRRRNREKRRFCAFPKPLARTPG